MNTPNQTPDQLAAFITKNASQQTYQTIKFLVDRPLIPDAYRAYAYFRWVDDSLDENNWTTSERLAFLERQQFVIDHGFANQQIRDLSPEERMVARLIRLDPNKSSGLHAYIQNMMAVMAFDAERRGRWITQGELNNYARTLAAAVTEALHYFIGNTCYAPRSDERYLAASGAHITHMLRDTFDDLKVGYFNIPRELLEAHNITPFDVNHVAYRAWVKSRVNLARTYFNDGRAYLAQVECLRCRLAGYAYIARFEWVLDIIEKENYVIRPSYDERKSLDIALKMAWGTLAMGIRPTPHTNTRSTPRSAHSSGGQL